MERLQKKVRGETLKPVLKNFRNLFLQYSGIVVSSLIGVVKWQTDHLESCSSAKRTNGASSYFTVH
ncbi:MAG: hypothetical protein IPF81_19265 [Bacteroidetes bacterium]|nr:hypothetical protein [Bacteroidota bacterium]